MANLTCPRCGAERPHDGPGGLCPHCLARTGMELNLGGNALPEAALGLRLGGHEPEEDHGSRGLEPGVRRPAPALDHPLAAAELGDYELLEEIARGGMGVVYKARQRSLHRVVALKMVLGGSLASTALRQRFLAEAQVVASLQHPNIVAIHEVGEYAGQPFFAMDFVPGRDLAEILRAGPLPPKRAASFVLTTAQAVQYAHSRGLLHRDLKPSNILIDAADQPHITDFGLAKRLEDSSLCPLPSSLTVSGQVLGSPNFMAPEQAEGRQAAIGPASDIYSLGALLYHCLTGRPPFQAATLTEVLRQVVATEPAPPRLLNADVPRDLETICLKCLEKDAGRRYTSAQALANELSRFLRGEPVLARPLGPAGKTAKWCRRNPRLAGAFGVAFLSLALGLAGIAWQWRRAEAETQVARRNAYAADMKEAQRALEDSDLGRARELLDRHRPVGKAESRNQKAENDLRGWEWRYFWSRCQSDESFLLCRYSNYIASLAFSSDGRWLAVRRGEGDVAVWDALAQRPSLELPGMVAGDKAMAFSPRGSVLAVGRWAPHGVPVVSFWDMSVGREIASMALPSELRAAAFSPDAKLIATLCDDGSVRVCDVASPRVVTAFTTGSLDLRPSALLASSATSSPPGGESVARQTGAAQDGTRLGPSSNLFVYHYGCLLFSPDGRWLAVGEVKPRIRLRDRITGKETLIVVSAPADGITTLAFSPDGRLLAAGCGVLDHDVHIWDLATDVETRLAGHSGRIAALAFSPDGQTLASAGADQTIRLWDVARQMERRQFQGSAGEIWALAWASDGKSLVSGDRDGAVRYWDPTAKPTAAPYSILPALTFLGGLAFLPDSQSFLTATQPDGSILRWNTATLEVREKLDFLGTNHNSVALSQDGHWLALGDAAGHVCVWDLPARQAITNFVFQGVIAGLAFSPRGQTLGCVGLPLSRGGLDLKLWKVPGWQAIDLSGLDLQGSDVPAFSSDDRVMAAGYSNGRTVWWDLASGTKVASFECPGANGGGAKVAFSPDGKLFAAAAYYGGVTLWDMATRQPKSISRAFRELLYWISFSPDGRRVIASGTSPHAVLRLWDVETGRELAALPGEPGSYVIGFSPDGNTLWATANEGQALFWRAPSFQEIAQRERPTGGR